MARAFVGFGGNVGNKVGYIKRAATMLSNHSDVSSFRMSGLYRSDPVGYEDQDWFVNAVAELGTTLCPEALLEFCLSIENALGRVREKKWGPRTIDLDLLVYDDLEIATERLRVPHPRLKERGFVLQPLCELAPRLSVGSSVVESISGFGSEGLERLRDYGDAETVALVGASCKEDRYAFQAQRMLMDRGHSVVPVSLRGGSILGVETVGKVEDYCSEIDTVTVYVSPGKLEALVDGLIEKKPRRVIFNPGTESDRAERLLLANGIACERACTLVLLRSKRF